MTLVDPTLSAQPYLPSDASDWFAPLVGPVRASLDGAMRRAVGEHAWSLPRAGLGGAIALHVARSWGTRRWQEAARVAVATVELANERLQLGEPNDDERASWLQRDVSGIRRVWDGLQRRDEPLLRQVVDRALGGVSTGSLPISEPVLFLRGAVAAGVLAGGVSDADHGELDLLFTWLGLAATPLDGPSWNGALSALSLPTPTPSRELALDRAEESLDRLPHCDSSDAIAATLRRLRRTGVCFVAGSWEGWQPQLSPRPRPKLRLVPAGTDTIARYGGRWRPEVSAAMARLVDSDAPHLRLATTFLQHQGGKRLRPLLALAAAETCGADPRVALDAAAISEWLHQASLVLDDIVDEASLRRGAPTLHVATSTPFAVGVAVWILGRLHVAQRSLPDGVRSRLMAAATALAEGQRSELRHTADPELSLTGYYRIIEAKTARLFAAAAAMGGVCAGANAKQLRALQRYGTEAGLAFQVLDDVLDYTGNEGDLGKRPGTDMWARKVTLPILLLREALPSDEREHLASVLFDPAREPSADDLAWLIDRIVTLGVREDCIRRARTHLQRALDALHELPDNNGRDVLEALARRFVERTA